MEFLLGKIRENLDEKMLVLTISNPRKAQEIKKYSIRPVLVKGKVVFQSAAYTATQVFHENLSGNDLMKKLEEILPDYKQVQLNTVSGNVNALINKKGKAAIKITKKAQAEGKAMMEDARTRLSHNRKKKYILPEGTPVPFLIDLGVMTAEGKIVNSRYDKYRQINRFLEFVEDILPELPKDREVTILDFGCGKSYLTFAMYYYLKKLKGYNIKIIGLDLKTKVIRDCNKLANKYKYDKLKFYEGSIEEFEGVEQVDMVVTLHACDTATDYALYKAANWGARVILSVPCCQHELNGQLKAKGYGPITDYGILKERFSALATDGIRAKLLEAVGYDTQILEFIDMEHTPKNLMIRGIRKTRELTLQENKWNEVQAFCDLYAFKPTLYQLFEDMMKSEKQ